jgi:hypothetical protein
MESITYYQKNNRFLLYVSFEKLILDFDTKTVANDLRAQRIQGNTRSYEGNFAGILLN